jgi:hypothetical protein
MCERCACAVMTRATRTTAEKPEPEQISKLEQLDYLATFFDLAIRDLIDGQARLREEVEELKGQRRKGKLLHMVPDTERV